MPEDVIDRFPAQGIDTTNFNTIVQLCCFPLDSMQQCCIIIDLKSWRKS